MENLQKLTQFSEDYDRVKLHLPLETEDLLFKSFWDTRKKEYEELRFDGKVHFFSPSAIKVCLRLTLSP